MINRVAMQWQVSLGIHDTTTSVCSYTIYFVTEIVYICVFNFASFLFSIPFVHANHCQKSIFSFILFSYLVNIFPSEYAFKWQTEVSAINSSYVSILSLTGLHTVHPDFVLVISYLQSTALVSLTPGLSVTEVQVLWSSFCHTWGWDCLPIQWEEWYLLIIHHGALYHIVLGLYCPFSLHPHVPWFALSDHCFIVTCLQPIWSSHPHLANTSSNDLAVFFICNLRYCSNDIGVTHMYQNPTSVSLSTNMIAIAVCTTVWFTASLVFFDSAMFCLNYMYFYLLGVMLSA